MIHIVTGRIKRDNTNHPHLADDANKTVHRTIESKLKCTPTIVEYGEHIFVPHCALDAGRVAAQFGYVDATSNRSFTMMEFCKSNVTHEIIFGQSRLQHHSIDDGEQLPLTATQLHSNLADNIGHSPFDDKDRLLLEDMFAKEDRGFKPDELAYAWSTPQGVRSYLAWRLFLFNAHKFGLEYLVQAAPQMAGRLVPVVELIRESAKATEAPLDLYTGFSDEVSDIRSESTGKMVKVPTFVWFLADRESAPSDGVVYVVVNGNLVLPREMCENRCVGPVYCCRIGEIGKHVSIINELFIDSSDL